MQQTQHTRIILVGLGKHSLRRLRQHVAFCVIDYRFCHVRITNDTFAGLRVFIRRGEILFGVLKAILDCADARYFVKCVLQGGIQRFLRGFDLFPRLHADIGNAQRIGAHIVDADGNILIGFCSRVNIEWVAGTVIVVACGLKSLSRFGLLNKDDYSYCRNYQN